MIPGVSNKNLKLLELAVLAVRSAGQALRRAWPWPARRASPARTSGICSPPATGCASSAGPPPRGAPARADRLDPAVDRIGQRHPQRPARPGIPRRPHHRGPLRPDHPAVPGLNRHDLAQLARQHAIPDRLRPLNPKAGLLFSGQESLIYGPRNCPDRLRDMRSSPTRQIAQIR
jgi:hypothetical protein